VTAPQIIADVVRADGSSDTAAAVASTDELGTDLYRRLLSDAGTDAGNLLLSPISIELALAMTRNGAAGQTRDQMDHVLHTGAGDELDRSLNALDQALATRSGHRGDQNRNGDVALAVANSLWGQQGFRFEQPFLDTLASDYGAGMHVVDYGGDADGSRRTINQWVADRTDDKIPELLPGGSIDAMTRLVLANAVYFKAPWAAPFTEVGSQPFTRADGTVVSAPAMSASKTARTSSGSGWQAATIPYLGGELSMTVIVPDDLADFEQALDGSTLAAIAAAPAQPLGRLQMPTFTFRSSSQLQGPLSAVGMPLAFDPQAADFSAMTADDHLFVSDVYHQAFIAVDEQGTEAAAATASVMEATSAISSSLVVDRPFVFVIRDEATGATLFLGRVTDPTAT
jgi:serpin B